MKNKLLFFFIFAVLAWFLQSNNLWLGDGYTIQKFVEMSWSQIISTPDSAFFIHPIPILCAKYLTFPLFSILCGLVYLYFVLKLAERNSKDYLILLCLPIIQIFFGYTEVYASFYASSIGYFYFYINKEYDRAVYILPIAILSHFIMSIPLLCSFLILYFHRDYNPLKLKGVLITIASFLWGGIMLIKSQVASRFGIFMPLTGYYSLFSWDHIKEILFLFTLLGSWIPFVMFRKRYIKKRFLFPSLIGVVIVLGLNSHLGILRDWDLFGFFCIPLVFFIIDNWRIRYAGFAVSAAITAAFLIFNHSPYSGDFMYKYMLNAPQYSYNFMGGHVVQTTSYIYHRIGDDEKSKGIVNNAQMRFYAEKHLEIK